MTKVWKSSLPKSLKSLFFEATVESVLMYECESWTLTANLEKELGCYTRLLKKATNVHWQQRITNKELYGDLPVITEKIRKRRLKLAGHCVRHSNIVASNLKKKERTTHDYLHRHTGDTGLNRLRGNTAFDAGQRPVEDHQPREQNSCLVLSKQASMMYSNI